MFASTGLGRAPTPQAITAASACTKECAGTLSLPAFRGALGADGITIGFIHLSMYIYIYKYEYIYIYIYIYIHTCIHASDTDTDTY